MNIYAAMNPSPYRDGRHKGGLGRIHAVELTETIGGPQPSTHALCSQQAAIQAPLRPFQDVPPVQQCGRCAKVLRRRQAPTPGPAAHEDRERFLHHDDPIVTRWLRALDNGSVGGRSRKPRSTATMQSYHGTVDRLYRWVNGSPWDSVDEDDLWEFMNRPKFAQTETVSGRTGNQNRSALMSFFGYAHRKGLVGHDPTEELGVREVTDNGGWPPIHPEIWDALWSSDLAQDDRLALGLGYFAGLRVSEIVTLAPGAIDPDAQKIDFLQRKGGKTIKGLEYGALTRILQRELPDRARGVDMWIDLVAWTARYRHDRPTLVPVRTRKATQWLRDRLQHHILPGAGLDSHAFVPHQLRASFATNMATCQLPDRYLADQMSHTNTATTMRYVDMTNQINNWFEQTNAPIGTIDFRQAKRQRQA